MIHQVSWDDTESVTDINKVIQDSLKRNDGFFPPEHEQGEALRQREPARADPVPEPGTCRQTANRLLRRNHADRIGKSEVE